tara:strand:+ start:43 stop:276 length:234 start_codon:yes stop_codon:yes gene_type:complete
LGAWAIELETLWSLDESDTVISDNNWTGSVGELKNLLFTLDQCSFKDMIEKGFGDRLDSGLALRQVISTEGKLIHIK